MFEEGSPVQFTKISATASVEMHNIARIARNYYHVIQTLGKGALSVCAHQYVVSGLLTSLTYASKVGMLKMRCTVKHTTRAFDNTLI